MDCLATAENSSVAEPASEVIVTLGADDLELELLGSAAGEVDLDLVLGAEVLPDLVPYGIVERHGPFGCIVRVVAVDAESQCGLRCARRSLEIPVDYTSGMDLFEPVVTSKVGASHIV